MWLSGDCNIQYRCMRCVTCAMPEIVQYVHECDPGEICGIEEGKVQCIISDGKEYYSNLLNKHFLL